MRLLSTNSLEQDMTLAKPIFNGTGQVLISEGVPLTSRMIDRLLQLGITYVYIEDPRTKDIEIHEPITERSRREAINTIQETFNVVKDERLLAKTFVFDRLAKKFSMVVRDILSQVKDHKDVLSLLTDVCAYDNYIFTHSLNVTIYSLALGMELNLSCKQLEELGMGAILHDVGKRVVPFEVLSKPGKLTDQEYNIVKRHAEDGFSLLRHVPNIPLTAAHCAYQHHERLDGSGYPRGLQGDKIHYYSRILAIADVYDAVTSNRVYRKAMLPQEGLEILYAGAGTKFELHMVEAFRRAIAAYPIGLTVNLSDGRKGVVIRQNPGLSDRPIIRIFEHNGKILKATYELNLKDELSVVINGTDTTLMAKR